MSSNRAVSYSKLGLGGIENVRLKAEMRGYIAENSCEHTEGAERMEKHNRRAITLSELQQHSYRPPIHF